MEAEWAIPALVEEEARERLERLARGSLISIRRLLTRPAIRSRIELVFMPCRQVLPSEREGTSLGFILVNGFSRQAYQIREAIPTTPASENQTGFPYILSDQETLTVARGAFLSWKLSRISGGQRDSADFVLGGFLMYPFWARYGESRSGKISLDLVDGVTGRPGGVMLKQAYLDALKSQN